MPDIPATGGVRSLLAKFESNNQNTSTSPPSRGRSPGGSETPGSVRPLSKVRASFVSVEKDDKDPSQRSATMSPVEKSVATPPSTSPHRTRTILSGLQNNGVGNVANNQSASNGAPKVDKTEVQGITAAVQKTSAQKSEKAHDKAKETVSRQALASKTVTKRPSTVALAKDISASKLNSKPSPKEHKAAATSKTGTPASHRTPTQERSAGRAAPTKQSTPSSTKPARSGTPSQDSAKKPALHSSPSTRRPKSPTRPVRLPASLTASTASAAAKMGNLSRSPSRATTPSHGLTRKPSTLKNDSPSRFTAPTASSLRRQPSRQSLPAHSAVNHDRPKSRVSTTGTRPHDDSFLARMMRPTASSANKVHEKVEPKSPPKATKTVAKPVRKSGDKIPERRPTSSTSKESQPAEQPKEEPVKEKEPEVAGIEHELPPPQEEPVAETAAEAPNTTAQDSEKTPAEPAASTVNDVAIEVPAEVEAESPTEAATAVSEDVVSNAPAEAQPVDDSPKEVLNEEAPKEAATEHAQKDVSIEVPEETASDKVIESVEQPSAETEKDTPAEVTAEATANVDESPEQPATENHVDPVEDATKRDSGEVSTNVAEETNDKAEEVSSEVPTENVALETVAEEPDNTSPDATEGKSENAENDVD